MASRILLRSLISSGSRTLVPCHSWESGLHQPALRGCGTDGRCGRIVQRFLWNLNRHAHTAALKDEIAGDKEKSGFLDDFGFQKAFVKKHFPDLLKPAVQVKLRPVFEKLKELEVENKTLKALLKQHAEMLRGYSGKRIHENIEFLSKAGLSDLQTADAVKKHPAILLYSVKDVLEPKIKFLKDRGLCDEAVTALLSRSPGTMSCDIQKELSPRIAYLAMYGIDKTFLGRSLVRNPMLLSYDVHTRLRPVVAVLKTKLQDRTIRQLAVYSPSIFGRDVEMLKELLDALKYIGHHNQGPWVESVAWGSRYGVEAVRNKIDFLMSLDIPYRLVVQILRAEPHIFKVDNPVIKLKVDFFLKEMKFTMMDLLHHPSYLSKKVMDRVKIRWEVMSLLKERGIINHIRFRDLLSLSKKTFVKMFVFKYPDCGRIYYGARSELKQSRQAAKNPKVERVSYY